MVGRVAEVAVERHNVVAGAGVEREAQRLAQVEVHLVMEHPDPGTRGGERIGDRARLVGAAVVYYDPLPVLMSLSEYALRSFLQGMRPIEAGGDDGDPVFHSVDWNKD